MIKKHILLILLSVFIASPVLTTAETDVDNSTDPSCAVISTNLRYLSRDTNTNGGVSILQDFLNSNGYLKSQPTGFFGGQTRSAVIAFQRANSLSATPPGFVGSATRAMIKKIDCDGAISTTPVVNKPVTPSVTAPATNPVISGNESNVYFPLSNAVFNIGQTYKITWSGYDNLISNNTDHQIILVGDGYKEGVYISIGNISSYEKSFTWSPQKDILPGRYKMIFNGKASGTSSEFFTVSPKVINPTTPDPVNQSPAFKFYSQIVPSDKIITSHVPVQYRVVLDMNKIDPINVNVRITCLSSVSAKVEGDGSEKCNKNIPMRNIGNNVYIANVDFTNTGNSTQNIYASLVSNVVNGGNGYVLGGTEVKIKPTTIPVVTTPVSANNPPFDGNFNYNLEVGYSGPNVKALINFLAARGFLSLTTANTTDDYFNESLRNDLSRFQASIGISPADGKFGPLTRAYFNGGLINNTTPTTPVVTTPVVTTPVVTTPVVSNDKCSIKINNVTYTLNPCSIDTFMNDTLGNKNFSTTIISSDGSSSYGFSVKGYGVGFPDYGILGASSGGARGNTPINLYFNDSYLSSDGPSSKIYSGYLPIHIFQGSEGSDNNYLQLKINLRVDAQKG